jgi:hypothetical protein
VSLARSSTPGAQRRQDFIKLPAPLPAHGELQVPLVPLGAVRVRLLLADGVNESCLVMQDIEGSEFCLD